MDELIVIKADELRKLIREAVAESQPTRPPPREYLRNTKEIASYLGVSPRSIPSMVSRDGLPATVVQGKYRARRDDVREWFDERLASGRVPSTHSRRKRTRRK